MRKLLTFFFAALMSVGMFALTPQGEDIWDEDNKTLTVNSNPGNEAYQDQSDIKHVIINNGVTSIGEAAFAECSNLETVTNYATTPQNIESKDVFAGVTLSGCTLSVPAESVIAYSTASVWQDFGTIAAIPEPASAWVLRDGDEWDEATKTLTVKSNLPYNAYKHQTVIKHVIISSGVTSIGYSAFVGCEGLKSVTIPSSVTSIGVNAFVGCINLTSVTIPNSVASIAFGVFSFCIGLTSVTIPEGVTSIEEGAFYECRSLTSIEIPNSVKSIDKWAFIYCSKLASVTINATTPPTLGDSPFKHTAEGLKIYVPAGSVDTYKAAWSDYADKIVAISWVREGDAWDDATKTLTVNSDLPENAYKDQTVIQHVIISNSVTSVGNSAFYGCTSMTSVTIPNGVTSIGSSAFSGCVSLTSVTIPSSVTSIGSSAFYGCKGLTEIVVNAENPNYSSEDGVLFNKAKTTLLQCPGGKQGEYTIPSSVDSIGGGVFFGCTGLTSIEIPNGVTSIGDYAFAMCSSLASIEIPNSVISIGESAFAGCSDLTSVTCVRETPANLGNDAFNGTHANLKIYVPAGSVNTYKAGWTAYADKIKAIPPAWLRDGDTWDDDTKTLTVNSDLPENAYKGQTVIEHVIISSGVTSIGNSAFSGDTGLKSVSIGNSVTSIGQSAFQSCTGLTSVKCVRETPASLGNGAFDFTHANLKIYVPAGSVNTYKAAENWSAYAAKIKAIPPAWVRDGDEWDNATKTLTVNSNPGYRAYNGQAVIQHVIINNGVTSIGNYAFEVCTGLTFVTIPEGVTSIGHGAFAMCSSLASIEFPNSVTYIGNWAFNRCSNQLKVTCVRETPANLGGPNAFPLREAGFKIYVPAGSVDAYKAAENWSYYKDNIVGIPPSWVRDGDDWNDASKTLTVNSDLPNAAYMGKSVIQHVIINNSVTSIGYEAFAYCTGLTSITNPNNSVTSIGDYAFYYCTGLPSITIPNSVTSIGERAFAGCSGLTSITIPNSVTSIGEMAFAVCTGLPSITIPKSVTSIGTGAFAACTALTSIVVASENTTYDSRDNRHAIIETSSNKLIVGCQYTTIPNSVTSIGVGAFAYCTGLTSITIPEGVTSIGESAFAGCEGLTSVTIPSSVTSIGDEAFAECSDLTSITIPNSVEYIGNYAFNDCSDLTSVTIPNSVDSIREGAFSGCEGLTSVTIGNSVTSIGDEAFAECSGLTSVEIPNSVTSIGDSAFYGCSGLTSVTCVRETPASLGNDAFNECSNLNAIYVPCGTLDAYQSSWTQYQSNIKYAQPEYTIIGNVNIAGAGTVILPQTICDNSITASPNYGYHFAKWSDGNTENPRTIELTQDTTFTAEFAYDRTGKCGNDLALTWTYDPEGKVLTISGNGAFEQNMQCGVEARGEMTKVIFEDGVTSIGYGAFDGCTGLTSVTIGNSVTSIGQMAFFGCSHLTSVTIGNSVTSIGDNAFQNCSGLTSITIPNSVTRIGVNAFYGCTGLSSIEIPSSVTRIGGFAFDGCTSLETVTIHAESLEHYGAYAFDGTAEGLKIYVPAGSVGTYKAAWDAYKDKIVAIPAPTPTAVENVQTNEVQASKILRDGQILILRDGRTYTLTGQAVK